MLNKMLKAVIVRGVEYTYMIVKNVFEIKRSAT